MFAETLKFHKDEDSSSKLYYHAWVKWSLLEKEKKRIGNGKSKNVKKEERSCLNNWKVENENTLLEGP